MAESVNGIRDAILAFVARSTPGFATETVSDDFDLLAEGVLDSLGFMHLLADLETLTGEPIDLGDIAPDRMTVVGALAAHIAHRHLLTKAAR